MNALPTAGQPATRGPQANCRGAPTGRGARHVALGLALLAALGGCSGPDGEFTISPASLDLAASGDGPAERRVVLTLTNTTQRRVRLVDIESTCGCAIAQPLESAVLEPGQSLPLLLQVALPEMGSRLAEIIVQTDHPDHPRRVVTMTLRGRPMPVPRLMRQPERLDLTGAAAGERVEGLVFVDMIEAAAAAPQVTGLRASNGSSATAEMAGPPAEEPGPEGSVRRTYQFRVLATTPASGAESFRLGVATRDSLASHARFAFDTIVFVRHESPVRVTAAIVVLSQPEPVTRVHRQVVVASSDGTAFEIDLAGSAPTPGLQCALETERGPAARHVIAMACDLLALEPGAEVRLKINHPRCAVVRIPLHLPPKPANSR